MTYLVLCVGEPSGIELRDGDQVVVSSASNIAGGKKVYRLGPLLKGQTIPGNLLVENRGYKKAVPKKENPLLVKYYSQLDSTTGQAYRMCFSSCCAMLLNYLKPGTLTGDNGDDQYLTRVNLYGDSTESNAQVSALQSFGLAVQFRTDLDWSHIDFQLARSKPVPIGILHTGPASAPNGGGHWVIIVGKVPDGSGYYVHDPYGDLDLINGTYDNAVSGANLIYSKENLGKRWMVGGSKGWGIIAL